MKILIVDDEEGQNKTIIDAIQALNEGLTMKIEHEVALTKEDGINKLRTNHYDAAIIDLRLKPNDSEGEGNEIIQEVLENLKFPIRVITGNKELLNPDYAQKDTILFKSRSRGDEEYVDIINELLSVYNTGIVNILNNKGKIQENISNIFWNHISSILPEFISYKEENPDWDIEKVLLRYTSSHILEYLEISIDNNLEEVHNIEFYIKPPVKSKIFTGDIIKLEESSRFGIILTPACDLATDSKRTIAKAEYTTIVLIDDEEKVLNNKNSGEIKKLKSNSQDLKYHYLPKTTLFQGGFINFQNIQSIPTAELQNTTKYKVECVITSPFRKDIISRFSNYFSRQGQPVFYD